MLKTRMPSTTPTLCAMSLKERKDAAMSETQQGDADQTGGDGDSERRITSKVRPKQGQLRTDLSQDPGLLRLLHHRKADPRW